MDDPELRRIMDEALAEFREAAIVALVDEPYRPAVRALLAAGDPDDVITLVDGALVTPEPCIVFKPAKRRKDH